MLPPIGNYPSHLSQKRRASAWGRQAAAEDLPGGREGQAAAEDLPGGREGQVEPEMLLSIAHCHPEIMCRLFEEEGV